jgi:hypothetical protein
MAWADTAGTWLLVQAPALDAKASTTPTELAAVSRPLASTVITGMLEAPPYAPGTTVVAGSRLLDSVPTVMLRALVVSTVADEANPLIDPAGIVEDALTALLVFANT